MSIAELIISIANKVKGIKDNVLAAYDVIERKGGVIPEEKNISNLQGAIEQLGGYTGHIDEVGLRAIGWRDEDIEWIKTRVDWMAEDDELYKVPQKLIDIYNENGRTWNGELITAHKSQPYYRWCPYFETTEEPSPTNGLRHNNAYYIIGFPKLNFIGQNFYNFFTNCKCLKFIPEWKVSSDSLKDIPITVIVYPLNTANLSCTINSPIIRIARNVFGTTKISESIYLKELKLEHAYGTCDFYRAVSLPKEEILYMITHSAGNTATITLDPFLLEKMQADVDVQNALNDFPNITLTTK